MRTVIDKEGFRHGIGIIIVNDRRQVFLAKRVGKNAWQFPQGGIIDDETPEQAMFRELQEEVGLNENDVTLVASTRRWLRYRLPKKLVRYHSKPICIGQKQKWFLLRLKNKNVQFNLSVTDSPEFDSWAWVSYWYPLKQVISFKKRVYGLVLKEFARIVLAKRVTKNNHKD